MPVCCQGCVDSSVCAFVGVDVWNCAGSVLGVAHVSEYGLRAYTRVHAGAPPPAQMSWLWV